MNNFNAFQTCEEEIYSQSSHETIETVVKSLLSSDYEDQAVRNAVSRLSALEKCDKSKAATLEESFDDSLLNKMANLTLNSSTESPRPKHLGISPPRTKSTLTITTNHPLMSLGSPDDNSSDLVLKKVHIIDEEKDLSLSSIDDEKVLNHSSGCEFYCPQMNTSKNNLYISENFLTAESKILSESFNIIASDVPKVEQLNRKERGKTVSNVLLTPNKVPDDDENSAITRYRETRNTKIPCYSTPISSNETYPEDFRFAMTEWCEHPAHVHSSLNFELPIEMSGCVGIENDLESPDVSSKHEDKSTLQAVVDPYTGNVALCHRTPKSTEPQRRKIQLPPELYQSSSDSISGCSLESDEELPEPKLIEQILPDSEVDNAKRSKSPNTFSECSDPIPEYSAAEELHDERSWLTVQHSGRSATCDMKVIEPYKRMLSHGGYEAGGTAIIVFSACYLPDTARPDYKYVMDNLFLYVIWSLEQLITDEYALVYLHGSAGRRRVPTLSWLHEYYKLIDRRLKKSLKHLYIVHPTFWLKSFVVLTKPFISSKFFRKLNYVRNLRELMQILPVEPNAIPELVKEYDASH